MKTIAVVVCTILLIILLIISLCNINLFIASFLKLSTYFLEINWKNLVEAAAGNTIGGAIGGAIVYYLVIRRSEHKRERRAIKREQEKNAKEKKEKCTQALLSTQMVTILQMEASRGIEDIAGNILHFSLLGKMLEEHLKDIPEASARAGALLKIINQENYSINNFLPLTNYLIINPIANNIITLPYEIFAMPTISLSETKTTIPEFAAYFKKLALCNIKYSEIISLIMRSNTLRDLLVNQPVSRGENGMSTQVKDEELYKYLLVGASMFQLALNLKRMVTTYLENANSVFNQSAHYIELLGVSKSIPVEKDENDNIIFDRF